MWFLEYGQPFFSIYIIFPCFFLILPVFLFACSQPKRDSAETRTSAHFPHVIHH